jgi:hypothetical protein
VDKKNQKVFSGILRTQKYLVDKKNQRRCERKMLIFLLISIILIQCSVIAFLVYYIKIIQEKLDEQRLINELKVINGNSEEFTSFHEYSKSKSFEEGDKTDGIS